MPKANIQTSYLRQHLEECIAEYAEGKSANELREKYGGNYYTWKNYISPVLESRGILRNKTEAMKLAGKQGKFARPMSKTCNPMWKGGVVITSGGYRAILMPEHPKARKSGYILEHIVVWEQAHGRPLPKGWRIHHANGIVTDNRPENLIAMPDSKHDNYIPLLKKRIRELEAEVGRLQRALENNQLVFPFSGN